MARRSVQTMQKRLREQRNRRKAQAKRDEVDRDLLATYPPDSEQQQAAVSAIGNTDGFNWGYDPLHYTTPEGSYATDPDGTVRILEFRSMVQALNTSGLRVVTIPATGLTTIANKSCSLMYFR